MSPSASHPPACIAFWGEGAASALGRLEGGLGGSGGPSGARWIGRHGGVVLTGPGARLRSARAQAAGVALVGTCYGAAGELLARLGSHGPAALAGEEGSFFAVGWSGERAWVQGDPWASRRLFARELPGGVALANDLAPLVALGGPAPLDPAQAITFLLTGRFFAGGCLGAGLRLLRPGERWHLVRGQLHVEPLPPPWLPAEVDAAQAAARLPAAIERAVERAWAAAPSPWLLLSGGYDSRVLFHALAEPMERRGALATVIWARGCDRPGSDAALAAALAERAGVRHLALERDPEAVVAGFDEAFELGCGLTEGAFTHADEPAILRRLAAEHGAGALLRGDECFAPSCGLPATLEEAIRQGCGWLGEPAAAALAGAFPAVAEPWLAAYAAALETRLTALPEEPLALRDALYAGERIPAFLHALSFPRQAFLEVLNPLLDLEVVALHAALPPAERVGKAWLRRWYHARWPDPLPIATVGNAIDWDEELPRLPAVRAFLEERLARLPPPFEPAFFRRGLDQPLETVPPAPGWPSPVRLAARAAILGRWFERGWVV